MKFLRLALFCGVLSVASSTLPAQQTGNTGKAALLGLPMKFFGGVVKLSADNASPNPVQWYVLARNNERSERLFSLTVVDGQIVAEQPSLDLRQLLGRSSFIDVERIRIDSPQAYQIAEQYAQANNRRLGSVSFVLQREGRDAAPVWSVWCYDTRGRYFGMLQILATTGTVIDREGLPNRPSAQNTNVPLQPFLQSQ